MKFHSKFKIREHENLSGKYNILMDELDDKCHNLDQDNMNLHEKLKFLEKENIKLKNKLSILSEQNKEDQRKIKELNDKLIFENDQNEKHKKEWNESTQNLQFQWQNDLNKILEEKKELQIERNSLIENLTKMEAQNSSSIYSSHKITEWKLILLIRKHLNLKMIIVDCIQGVWMVIVGRNS